MEAGHDSLPFVRRVCWHFVDAENENWHFVDDDVATAETENTMKRAVLRPERAEMSARGSSEADDGNAAGDDGKRLGDAFWEAAYHVVILHLLSTPLC